MYFKNNTKQRIGTIQGLRSLKDTLPKNIKKIINKRGHIYSEILNNWKLIVGTSLFKICYPKFYQSSNKFNDSTLVIVVERGHEVELEYSRKEIINRINNFFEYSAVKKIKLMSFEDEKISSLNKKKGEYKKFFHFSLNTFVNSLKDSLIFSFLTSFNFF